MTLNEQPDKPLRERLEALAAFLPLFEHVSIGCKSTKNIGIKSPPNIA